MTIMLTLRDLRLADACSGQLEAFRRRFGSKVVATVTTAVAHADDFDWYWAADALLTGDYRAAFHAEMWSWSWDALGWKDEDGFFQVDPVFGHLAFLARRRFEAAAFAKQFLAQGGSVRRGRKPSPAF